MLTAFSRQLAIVLMDQGTLLARKIHSIIICSIAFLVLTVVLLRASQGQHPTVSGLNEGENPSKAQSRRFENAAGLLNDSLISRFDSTSNMNFYRERLQPVISGWTNTRLQEDLLSVDGIGQYADTYKPKLRTAIPPDQSPILQPEKYIATTQIVETVVPKEWSVHPAKRLASPAAKQDVIQDSQVSPTDFQVILPAADATREQLREQDLQAVSKADEALAKPQSTEDDQKKSVSANENPSAQQAAEQEPAGKTQIENSLEDSSPHDLTSLTEQDSIVFLTEEVAKQAKLIDGNETLEESIKSELQAILQASSQALQNATSFGANTKEQKDAQTGFTTEVQRIKEELEASRIASEPDAELSSDEMKMRLLEIRQNHQQLKKSLDSKVDQIEKREQRIKQLPELRTKADEKVREIQKKLADLPAQPIEKKAQLEFVKAKAQELEAIRELESLEIEAQRQEQVGTLLPLERSLINHQLKDLETDIAAWEEAMNSQRDTEIKRQLADAKEDFTKDVNSNQAFREMAERNERLAWIRGRLSSLLSNTKLEAKEVLDQCNEAESKLTVLKENFGNGILPANGMLLADLRASKLQPYRSQSRVQEINSVLKQIRQNRARLQQERDSISSTDEFVELLLSNNNFENVADPESIARDLAKTQLDYLNMVDKDYETYNKDLTDVQTAHLTLTNKVRSLGDFIYENALWIRSEDQLGVDDLDNSRSALSSFFGDQKGQWTKLFASIQQRVIDGKYSTAFCGFLLLGVFVVSQRLRRNNA